MNIVIGFPPPPPPIQHTLNTLSVLRSGDREKIAELGDIDDMPRPWDPASCDDELRRHLWSWLDDVVAWINREYAWRPMSLIPSCWPAHPHIARELPVLACLRVAADEALNPEPAEEWHRHALPLFMDRMTGRLGESGCRNDKHVDWPAAGRYQTFLDEKTAIARRDAFLADTHHARQLRPARSAD